MTRVFPHPQGRNDTASVDFLRRLAFTIPRAPNAWIGVVDVRDVARAHVIAMTHAAAAGRRFLLAPEALTFVEMGACLQKVYPQYKWPTGTVPKALLYLVGPLVGLSWRFTAGNVNVPVVRQRAEVVVSVSLALTWLITA